MRTAPRAMSVVAIFLVPTLLATLHSPVCATWPDPSTGTNLSISTAAGNQLSPSLCSDGAGGTIIVWNDNRAGGGYHIYAQRVDASGRTCWTADGLAICTAAGSQNLPRAIEDGSGGAFIVWYDSRTPANAEDIYAQHINGNGNAIWTSGGVPVCTQASSQLDPDVVSDGAGGIYIVWRDYRTGHALAYGQRLNANGAAQWAADGAALASIANGDLDGIDLASDGLGGFIVAWRDLRTNPNTIAANHLNSSLASLWVGGQKSIADPANMVPQLVSDGRGGAYIAFTRGYQVYVNFVNSDASWTFGWASPATANPNTIIGASLAADGAGGAIVSWSDMNVYQRYAQRVTAAGLALWGGVPGVLPIGVAGSLNIDGSLAIIVPDGSGGAVFSFPLKINAAGGANHWIVAAHVSHSGTVDWPGGLSYVQYGWREPWPGTLTGVTDGAGGAILSWSENNTNPAHAYDLVAQRVDKFGYEGCEPQIVRVQDVRNDQGGRVEVRWNATRLDVPGDTMVADYSLWRQVPLAAAQVALKRGAQLLAAGDARPDGAERVLRVTGTAAAPIYWEYVGQQPARGFAAYSYLAPTASDSLVGSNPLTWFKVEAENSSPTLYWDSAPESGYSVDNLPPGAPVFIASRRVADTTRVRWQPNAEPDLALYRLYRGTGPGFLPGAGNLVSAQADTGFLDSVASPYAWYKLTAVDAHGNEGAVATLSPLQITGAPESGVPGATKLTGASPNPFNPATLISFDLAQAARVRLSIFDAAGRRVRVLVDDDRAAGRYEVRWDGNTDDGRRASSGVYFCRMAAGSFTDTKRMTLLK